MKDCATSEIGVPVFVDTSLTRSPSEGDSMMPEHCVHADATLDEIGRHLLFRPITAALAAPYT